MKERKIGKWTLYMITFQPTIFSKQLNILYEPKLKIERHTGMERSPLKLKKKSNLTS